MSTWEVEGRMKIMKTEYETSAKLITQNRYSRPGRRLKGMRGLVVHWVANPGLTPRGAWPKGRERTE
jgi:hypothetical protein